MDGDGHDEASTHLPGEGGAGCSVGEGQGPVRVPRGVLDRLEAVRRAARTDALDVPTLRYAAMETGKPSLVVWIDGHPQGYGRDLLDGSEVEE